VLESVERVRLHDFEIDGNREKLAKPLEMAPPENAFRVWYPSNGVLANKVAGLEIERLRLVQVVNFPVLISQSSNVRISDVTIEDSGSKNARGRNNLSGGILIEEGSSDFEVSGSTFRGILGNALWTHSMSIAPRQKDGSFKGNHFDTIGRDAIQVGHATRVKVEDNAGVNIGFPLEAVDMDNLGTPVAIDTAGDVDSSVYVRNNFAEINGQCIDLDGFHDGAVQENRCINRKGAGDYPFGGFAIVMNNTHPNAHSDNIEISGNVIDGSKFGGLFLMGSRNKITGNQFLRLNLAGCNESAREFGCIYKPEEPEMLATGIYISRGVARTEDTRGNVIQGNRVSGHQMKSRCMKFGPGVSRESNSVASNACSDQAPAQ